MIMSAAKEAAGIVTAANAAIKRVFEIADMGVPPVLINTGKRPVLGDVPDGRIYFCVIVALKKCPLMAGNSEGN